MSTAHTKLLILWAAAFAPSTALAKRATKAPAPAKTTAPADSGPQCTAKIVIGNPANKSGEKPKPEQAVMDDPPVQLRQVVVQNGDLHGHTLYELWTIPNVAKPEKIVRYAGADTGSFQFLDGPCAGARFPQISGIAAAPDGSIVITDRLANAVVRIEAPGKSGCTARILAGSAPAAKMGSTGLNAGDKDGEGAAAKFSSPAHPVVDEKGDIYIIDNRNKVKRITGGAVTTVATLPTDSAYNYSSMTYLKGNLYVTFLQGPKNTVFEVDPASGKTRAVLEGNGGVYPPLNSSVVPGLGGITNDGTQLYITGRSLIWSLTPEGKLTLVAGNGKDEWGPREDPMAERPARSSPLPGNATNVDMTFLAGTGILFRGRAGYYNNSIIMKISCP